MYNCGFNKSKNCSCDKCCQKNKVKCKKGSTGPTGSTGYIGPTGLTGPTGPSALDKCISTTGCADPSDKIIVQQSRTTGFECEFDSTKFIIKPRSLFTMFDAGGLTISAPIVINNTSTSTVTSPALNNNCPNGATISFNYQTSGAALTNAKFSYKISGGNGTVISTTFHNNPKNTFTSPTITPGQTFSFILENAAGSPDAKVDITNFVVDYSCCRVAAVPISDYLSDSLFFSDLGITYRGFVPGTDKNTSPPTPTLTPIDASTARYIGQGNTSSPLARNPDPNPLLELVEFFDVAYTICKPTDINHVCVSIKNVTGTATDLASVSNIIYYSRCIAGTTTADPHTYSSPIGIILPVVSFPLPNKSPPANYWFDQDISTLLFATGDLIAIRTQGDVAASSTFLSYTAAVTLSYETPTHAPSLVVKK